MQYDADTPDEYLNLLEDDWRRDCLLAIREILRSVPGVTEGIGHKMLQYRFKGDVFAHLNAQKGYVGVYLGELERIDPGGAIRGNMSCGKTCLRVRKRDGIEVVEKLVTRKSDMAV